MLKDYIERLLLADSQDSRDEEDQDVRKNCISLMTLHGAKGLEFDNVYLMGMEEEILPHKKTIKEGSDINEERRLCYVGITRARQKLVLSYCQERELYGKKVKRHKSRFINELVEHYTEYDRTNFGHMSKEETEKYKKDFFNGLLGSLDDI